MDLQSLGSSYMVTLMAVVLVGWITLLDERATVNSSSFSTTLSSKMLIVTQRGALPTVSPGRNVSDVLNDE